MTTRRTYDDTALASAVASSHSWRGVLRRLGLQATSAGALRGVRRHANRLGLDYTHFTGQRRWTDEALTTAVAGSGTWGEVADALGLSGGSSTSTLKGHAVRLGIDATHLAPSKAPAAALRAAPDRQNLSRAGAMLAAAWFELTGSAVSWPLEPTRYDVLVWLGDRPQRVQVKTTVSKIGSTYVANISTSGSTRRCLRSRRDRPVLHRGRRSQLLLDSDQRGGRSDLAALVCLRGVPTSAALSQLRLLHQLVTPRRRRQRTREFGIDLGTLGTHAQDHASGHRGQRNRGNEGEQEHDGSPSGVQRFPVQRLTAGFVTVCPLGRVASGS
jgi:hypothetical protein